VRFADPDDALMHIERAIRAGDIDAADIFDDDGKVQTGALQTALADILEHKPHLRSSDTPGKPKGNPDTRRGNAADTDLEAMGPGTTSAGSTPATSSSTRCRRMAATPCHPHLRSEPSWQPLSPRA
jgi:hypothetical protein